MTSSHLLAAVEFLLDNMFLRFGNTVLTCGCHTKLRYSQIYFNIVMNHQNSKALQTGFSGKVKLSFRYLDNVLALNCPEFQTFAEEIYLKELTLK